MLKKQKESRVKSLINQKVPLFWGFIGILIFIGVSFIIQRNIESFQNLLQDYKTAGIFIYILLGILSTVFAPLTSVPLIPLASNLYGWFLTGVYSIIGWFIGSLIAFYIARKYGKPYVKKLVSLNEIRGLEKTVSKKRKFWGLIFIRMFLPVDLLTYALGIFTNIGFRTFSITTFIGIIPFAFILSYLGYLPILYQIAGWIIFLSIIFIVLRIISPKKLYIPA